ncbi:MAG: arginyltransferase [Pseudomonadota bacterium]|nr:arginyltransferase [Pseudomonadota bacterium]
MRHSLPKAPQFYVTAPQECPYLADKVERKLFTTLSGNDEAKGLNNALSKQGFRRSQNVLYRPSCPECSACLSARIPVSLFDFTRSQKRAIKRNETLIRKIKTPWATEEQYRLFKRYVESRHKFGGMSGMDEEEFSAMIEETSTKTILCEYAQQDNASNQLVAVSLTDILDDGLSMVYSFYDPRLVEFSLGKYMILDHIKLTLEMGLKNLYLGYWVEGSRKMDYKSQFKPLEVFLDGEWRKLDLSQPKKTEVTNLTESKPNDFNTIYLPENGK